MPKDAAYCTLLVPSRRVQRDTSNLIINQHALKIKSEKSAGKFAPIDHFPGIAFLGGFLFREGMALRGTARIVGSANNVGKNYFGKRR
jgi:hypothetical protein